MGRALVVSGHTDIDGGSVANRAILAELARLLPGAVIDRLDALYPDYRIDVAAEQAKLVAAGVVVLQYPVFWYGVPSLLKKWMEDVFVHGFSHGSTGDALAGKALVASVTSGAPESAYSPEGVGFTVDGLLAPIRATCKLTKMEFAGHVYTGDVSYLSRVGDAARATIEARAREHAARVADLIAGLE